MITETTAATLNVLVVVNVTVSVTWICSRANVFDKQAQLYILLLSRSLKEVKLSCLHSHRIRLNLLSTMNACIEVVFFSDAGSGGDIFYPLSD